MFQQGNVTVDDRFVRFGSKSFAINKLTSIDVREDVKAGSSGFVWFWVIGGVAAIAALTERSTAYGIIAAACAFFGWISWTRRQSTSTYRLFLVTAASEAQAFETKDQDEMMRLRTAIEDAMSRST